MSQVFRLPKLVIAEILLLSFLAILVIIGTFPENDWTTTVGIDPSLAWAFNHFFETDLSTGKHILFPHGPLAFFMYPKSSNIILATTVTALLKAMLVFNIYFLFRPKSRTIRWLTTFLLAFFIALVSNFNHLLIANLFALYSTYHFSRRYHLKIIAFIITAFALYIRAYVAIISGIVVISFLFYELTQRKDLKAFLMDGLTLLMLVLFIWMSLYGTLSGFFRYLFGMINLARDNSSAAAFYPYNNWILIGFSFLGILLLIILNRSKEGLFFLSISAFSIWAAWKHGMAREDIFHYKGFLIFLFIVITIFVLFLKKKRAVNFIIGTAILSVFTANITHTNNYFLPKYDLDGYQRFSGFLENYKSLHEKAMQQSEKNLEINKLPEKLRRVISNNTVDIYPWDYSIVAANNLNWKPRVVIQSYAAYTSWLDKQNEKHFATEDAPEYIIWEKEKVTLDVNGSSFQSIDNRYLLNDEPQTIIQLLKSYEFCCSGGKFLVLQKRKTPATTEIKPLKFQATSFENWIDVPQETKAILRLKLDLKKSLIQRVKSLLYKDEQFWIYLKLANNDIHKYRIVPKNASDGLWISPYLFNDSRVPKVKQIMFKASNQSILNNNIKINWEEVSFPGSPGQVFTFWGKNKNETNSLVFSSTNTFESFETVFWNPTSENHLSDIAFDGSKSYSSNQNEFSGSFTLPLDNISHENLRISTQAWVTCPRYKQSRSISLVLAIEEEKKNIKYKRFVIDDQLIDKKNWNHIFNSLEFKNDKPNRILKVYFWDTGKNKLLIDNFQINISAIKS